MTNVSLIDVKHLDGEPWEVAAKAGEQVEACFALLEEALDGFYWAARGAWLSQEDILRGKMPQGEFFAASPLGRILANMRGEVQEARARLASAKAAAAFDPRSY